MPIRSRIKGSDLYLRQSEELMQNVKQLSGTARVLLLGWTLLCVGIFIAFPGRVSYIHWSNLIDFPRIITEIQRINFIQYLLDSTKAIAGVALFSVSCASLGLFILHFLKEKPFEQHYTGLDWFAYLGTGFIIGHGIFALLFMTLAGLYKITSVEVGISLFLGFILGFRHLKALLFRIYSRVKAGKNHFSLRTYDKILIGLACSILFLSLFLSTARISYDASAIYFSDAKITALTGRIHFFTNDTFVASVFQTAIQFTALIQLFGDQAARLFSWICGATIIIFALALAEKLELSGRAKILSLAMLISSTSFLDLLGDGKVDLISFMPALAAVYWMVARFRRQGQDKSGLLIIGFLSGLSIVARPFNAFLLAIFILLFYFQTVLLQKDKNKTARNKLPHFLQTLIWISIGAVGLGIYHLFANWMIFRDPFAFMSSVSNINPATGPWNYKPGQLLTVRLLYPLAVSFDNTPQSLGNISPLFIAFLPALFLGSIREKIGLKKITGIILSASIVTLIAWIFTFFTVTEIRYVFFLWIILYYPVSELLAALLNNSDRYFNYFESGLVIALLIFINLRTIFISINAYSPIDSQGNPHCYDKVFCEYLAPINQTAGQGDRVLTLGAYRYYLRTDLFSCSTNNEEYSLLHDLSHQNPDAFWAEVYREGYSYIAYENEYTVRHLQFGMIPSPNNTPSWMQLQPLYGRSGDAVISYQIKVTNPPIEKEESCRRNADGVWQVTNTLQ